MNKTIFQFFHWYFPLENNLWNHCRDEAGRLRDMGISHVWLPPAYKSGKGSHDVGYAVYDLYDLGEFDQKGSVRTKFGTREEYFGCIEALHENGISVVADAVLNHRWGADEKQTVTVVRVSRDNRDEKVSGEEEMEISTLFNFPGRAGKYSEFVWDYQCFTGVSLNGEICLICNDYTREGWKKTVTQKHGNYDYLIGNDIEFRNPHVRDELKRWAEWYVDATHVDGFRLDGLKHMDVQYLPEWLDHLNGHFSRDFFAIGEYWEGNIDELLEYLQQIQYRFSLFDVPLHFKLHEASTQGRDFDLRTVFDDTLVQRMPESAITFVDNHDTQPLQDLESTVQDWFQPAAHALILLREHGIPCVFYPALYGARYRDHKDENEVDIELPAVAVAEKLVKVRAWLAYGTQQDYLDDPHVIGWTRHGNPEHTNTGCAVLISNQGPAEKYMQLGAHKRGRTMIDVCGSVTDSVVLDDQGGGQFKVGTGCVAVWIDAENSLLR